MNIPEPALLMACISSKLVRRFLRKPSQRKLQRKQLIQYMGNIIFYFYGCFYWCCCQLTFDSVDLAVTYWITVHLHQRVKEVCLRHHCLGWLPTDLLVATDHQDALTDHLHLFGWLGKGSAQWTGRKRQIEGEDKLTDGMTWIFLVRYAKPCFFMTDQCLIKYIFENINHLLLHSHVKVMNGHLLAFSTTERKIREEFTWSLWHLIFPDLSRHCGLLLILAELRPRKLQLLSSPRLSLCSALESLQPYLLPESFSPQLEGKVIAKWFVTALFIFRNLQHNSNSVCYNPKLRNADQLTDLQLCLRLSHPEGPHKLWTFQRGPPSALLASHSDRPTAQWPPQVYANLPPDACTELAQERAS